MSDPRVFFAAERTLLAWVRTGLTIIAFGFAVDRFGFFVPAGEAPAAPLTAAAVAWSHMLNVVGIALVLLGTVSMVFAAIQHQHFVRTLPAGDLPRTYGRAFPTIVALLLGLSGFALAIYLLFER